jgi:hypothetical protein
LALTAFLGAERASKVINTVSANVWLFSFLYLLLSQNVNDAVKRYNNSPHLLASSLVAKLRVQIGRNGLAKARGIGSLQHSAGTLTGPLVPTYVFLLYNCCSTHSWLDLLVVFACVARSVCVLSVIHGPYGDIQLPDQVVSDRKMKAFKAYLFSHSITIPDQVGGQFNLSQAFQYEVGAFNLSSFPLLDCAFEIKMLLTMIIRWSLMAIGWMEPMCTSKPRW